MIAYNSCYNNLNVAIQDLKTKEGFANSRQGASVVLALGSNTRGVLGSPRATLRATLDILEDNKIEVLKASRLYRTVPEKLPLQPKVLNAAVLCRTDLPAAGLLRILQQLEQRAGRNRVRQFGARPLDIDIIDYKARVVGWPNTPRHKRIPRRYNARGASLILPHPRAHLRHFVLAPLADISPYWVHPVFGRSISQLRQHLTSGHTNTIVDCRWYS